LRFDPPLHHALAQLSQGGPEITVTFSEFLAAHTFASEVSRAGVRCAVQLPPDETPLSAGDVTEPGLEELRRLARQRYDEARIPESVHVARRAVAASARLHGEGSTDHVPSLLELAYLARYACCFDEAEALYATILSLAERTVGSDHPLNAAGLAGLATLYRETARLDEAEPLFRRSLAIIATAEGEDHPNYGTILNDLGGLYREMGRPADAESTYARAVAVRRKAFGANHPAYAQSVINLAHLLASLGQRDRAAAAYREGLAVMRQAYGDTPRVRGIQADLDRLQLSPTGLPDEPRDPPPAPPPSDEHFSDRETFADVAALRAVAQAEGDDELLEAADEVYLFGVQAGCSGAEYAGRLNVLGEFARRHGRLDAAERLLRRCETLLRNQPGWELVLATTRANLALVCQTQDRLAEAEELYRQCVPVLTTALSRPHPLRASLLTNQAQFLCRQGRVSEAVALFEEGTQERIAVYGPDHASVATSLEAFVGLLMARDAAAAALPLSRRLVDHRRRAGGRDLPYAQALLVAAAVLDRLEDYAAAEPMYAESCALLKDLAPEEEAYRDALSAMGRCRESLERYPEAERAYQAALDIVAARQGETHLDVASLLTRIAQVRHLRGDYAAALPLLERAAHLYAVNDQYYNTDHVDVILLLSAVRLKFGEFQAAERLAEQARHMAKALHGENHSLHARALVALAEALRAGLFDGYGPQPSGPILARIEPLYRQAIAILTDAGEEGGVAMCHNNLALIHAHWGDPRTAMDHASAAIDICRRRPPDRTLPNHQRALANFLNVAAGIQQLLGDLKECEALAREALALRERVLGRDHPDLGATVDLLADVCYATGREAEGLEFLRRSVALADDVLSQVVSVGSERQILDCLDNLHKITGNFLSTVALRHRSSPQVRREALELVLRRKGLAAAALLARGTAEELAALRGQIARKALDRPAAPPKAHAGLLDVYETRRQRLERRQAAQASDAVPGPVSAGAVAGALPADAVLVEFVRCAFHDRPPGLRPTVVGDRYLAFVLAAGRPDEVHLADLGPADRLDRLIGAFRDAAAVLPGARVASLEEAGSALRAVVFDPLLPLLAERTRLLLATDGELSLIPFEALSLPCGRPLIDGYQLSYLGSGRDALRFGTAAGRQPGAPLVVADPAFNLTAAAAPAGPAAEEASRQSRDLDRETRFGPLKHTREEAEKIGAMLRVTPWLRADALEGRLKRVCSPRVLHLATHGFFLRNQASDAEGELTSPEDLPRRLARMENPLLRSGLALAGANVWLSGGALPPEAEDGLLTAEDVTGMDLAGTGLVVLSACNSGLGDVHVGEGVFGLRRAFGLAGARRLVTSLWKVPDEQTRVLMVDFYSRVLDGEGVPEALRGAQLALRRNHPDPHFWAAFICIGDPAPLPATPGSGVG
jgi:tetratricopeptide (TPR) repeat protein